MSTIRAKAFQHPSASSNNITFNADGTHTVNAQHPITNKNLLINGGMNVWQRSTSESITTAAYHTVDRWLTSMVTIGTFTQSRSTDVPSGQGFGYSLKMDCTTADASPAAGDDLVLITRLEGQNLQHLLKGTSSAKKVTLSFWVKSNKTGTYVIELRDKDNDRHICKAYTISATSTWEKKELTFDGDTTGTFDNDNANSLDVLFWLGAGSNYTSGTLATSWATVVNANKAVGQVNLADSTSNEFFITGCQLEVGEQATEFEFEPYVATLQKCLRYYRKITADQSGRRFRQGGVATASTNVSFDVLMPTPMRALPSMTKTDIELRNLSDTATAGAINAIFADDEFLLIGFSIATTGAISDGYSIRATSSSAKLDFDSEL